MTGHSQNLSPKTVTVEHSHSAMRSTEWHLPSAMSGPGPYFISSAPKPQSTENPLHGASIALGLEHRNRKVARWEALWGHPRRWTRGQTSLSWILVELKCTMTQAIEMVCFSLLWEHYVGVSRNAGADCGCSSQLITVCCMTLGNGLNAYGLNNFTETRPNLVLFAYWIVRGKITNTETQMQDWHKTSNTRIQHKAYMSQSLGYLPVNTKQAPSHTQCKTNPCLCVAAPNLFIQHLLFIPWNNIFFMALGTYMASHINLSDLNCYISNFIFTSRK